jgi:hypothetical protein
MTRQRCPLTVRVRNQHQHHARARQPSHSCIMHSHSVRPCPSVHSTPRLLCVAGDCAGCVWPERSSSASGPFDTLYHRIATASFLCSSHQHMFTPVGDTCHVPFTPGRRRTRTDPPHTSSCKPARAAAGVTREAAEADAVRRYTRGLALMSEGALDDAGATFEALLASSTIAAVQSEVSGPNPPMHTQCTHSTHPLSHPLTRLITHSLHSPTLSPTHPLNNSPTPLTHSLTHSPTQ